MSTATSAEHLIFTGPPGIGKTTATRRLADLWLSQGRPATGFYTEEVRLNGRRIGFDVVSIPQGSRAVLARTEPYADFVQQLPHQQPPRVAAYLVNVAAFEAAAAAALSPALERQPANPLLLVVIDEVGKMELFSALFRSLVERLFNELTRPGPPPYRLLVTLPVSKGPREDRLVSRLRSASGDSFHLNVLTLESRNAAPEAGLKILEADLSLK